MALSNSQRRYLRGLSHAIKPVVLMGAKGLTDSVIAEIEHALTDHELIKVRVSADDREARGEIIATICERSQAELIQRIGHVATLFRRNPETPQIELPR